MFDLSTGDSRCFLFSLLPSLVIYHPTGYNENFMYLNHQMQTLPNGLVSSKNILFQQSLIIQSGVPLAQLGHRLRTFRSVKSVEQISLNMCIFYHKSKSYSIKNV